MQSASSHSSPSAAHIPSSLWVSSRCARESHSETGLLLKTSQEGFFPVLLFDTCTTNKKTCKSLFISFPFTRQRKELAENVKSSIESRLQSVPHNLPGNRWTREGDPITWRRNFGRMQWTEESQRLVKKNVPLSWWKLQKIKGGLRNKSDPQRAAARLDGGAGEGEIVPSKETPLFVSAWLLLFNCSLLERCWLRPKG